MQPATPSHHVSWTSEQVARYWSYKAGDGYAPDLYFSQEVGDLLLAYARRNGVPLHGKVLDYGCGPGFLLKRLLEKGSHAQGLEFSRQSAQRAEELCREYATFGGVILGESLPSPLPSACFDSVFCIEAVEHMPDEVLAATLSEIHRVIRPGGTVMVTTPHDEDLRRYMVMCPDCGGVFHALQHVRTWQRSTLVHAMEDAGFATRRCQPVVFTRPAWVAWGYSLVAKLAGIKLPHLVYIGTRKG
jgi:SAM-dependent methyltransferase